MVHRMHVNLYHKYHQINEYVEAKTKKVIDEARSFRGSSQLDCAIYDITNLKEPEKERFKVYNLPGIINNVLFEWMDKNEFLELAARSGVRGTRFQEALCYLKLTGYRDVREDWRFYYPDDIDDIVDHSFPRTYFSCRGSCSTLLPKLKEMWLCTGSHVAYYCEQCMKKYGG